MTSFRRTSRTAALAAALCSLIAFAGCSGGGGGKPAVCAHPQPGTTGPGDTERYFPAELGDRWTYDANADGGYYTFTTTVTGTQPAGSDLAMVFTSWDGVNAPTAEFIQKTNSGVYALADGSVAPPLDQIYPTLLLPFPVAPTDRIVVLTCKGVDLREDLDGDGKNDSFDADLGLLVFTGESVEVPAGFFREVANVQTGGVITVHGSKLGPLEVSVLQHEWYAPGVGRVAAHVVLAALDVVDESSARLLSYQLVPVSLREAPAATAQVPRAPVAAAPGAGGFEAASLRAVRTWLGQPAGR